jgi:peptidoglycan/xylan/chitin deacetylase (PgdA/CDA1 family)
MGSFIISLDCEGKWGNADGLTPRFNRLVTDDALAAVYDQLVAMFARYDLPATFAYVMAFTLSKEEREQFPELRTDGDDGQDAWLSHYWREVRNGNASGWFQPHALDVVVADGRHEVACHSFCHRPLHDQFISAEGAGAELRAAQAVARLKGLSPSTFIFPRNMVGNLPVLKSMGYIGYRTLLPRRGDAFGRAMRVVEELNIWPQPQPVETPAPGEMVKIPAGYFFNWRSGARQAVPPEVTVWRWKNLLNRAARSGGVAHLWLHPHNLITGPGTARTLDRVLAHAARLRDKGKFQVVTQDGYCRQVLAKAG